MKKRLLLAIISMLTVQFMITAQNTCNIICLDDVRVSLGAESAELNPLNLLKDKCELDIKLTLKDENDNIIFEQTDESSWTVTQEDIDNTYTFTINEDKTANTCTGSITIQDINEPLPDDPFTDSHLIFPGEDSNLTCTLACLDQITASLSSDGTGQIWPLDLLNSVCKNQLKLTIRDDENNIIFEQTTEDYWTLNQDHADKTFSYAIEEKDSGNSCWGNITILDKPSGESTTGNSEGETTTDTSTDNNGGNSGSENADCASTPADFSSFMLKEKLEFDGKSLEDINEELEKAYTTALTNFFVANKIDDPLNSLIRHQYSDVVTEKENGDLTILRAHNLIDFCHYQPHSEDGTGKYIFVQTIVAKNLGSMKVSGINFGQSDTGIAINNMKLINESGKSALINLTEQVSIGTAISNTIQEQEWQNGVYKLEVDKFGSCATGVSSLDIVITIRHILGLETFDSNVKLIAADTDDNNKITTNDVVKMRRTVLGLDDCNNDSNWRFYKSDLNTDNTFDLSMKHDFDLSYSINSGVTDVNIVALKKGDVNFSAIDSETDFRSINTSLTVENQKIKLGESYDIDLKLNEDTKVISGTIDFKNTPFEILEFSSEALDINNDNFYVTPDKSKVLFYKNESKSLKSGEVLLTMKIKATQNGSFENILKNSIKSFEVYSSVNSRQRIILDLDVIDQVSQIEDQITYNTIMNQGRINIFPTTHTDSKIQDLSIFTMDGRQVYSQRNMNIKEASIELYGYEYQLLVYNLVTNTGKAIAGKFLAQ